MLFWKEGEGHLGGLGSGGCNGMLYLNKQKIIPESAWDNFQALLKGIDFWNLETKDEEVENDGAQWILEGKTNDKYHVFNKWSPVSDDKFYKCCDYLITLTDLEIKPVDKY